MKPFGPVLVYRQAVSRLTRHGCNLFPLEAFGFLVGSIDGCDFEARPMIYAAFPVGKGRAWYADDGRYEGMATALPIAQAVALRFGLEVVGTYLLGAAVRDEEPPSLGLPFHIARGIAGGEVSGWWLRFGRERIGSWAFRREGGVIHYALSPNHRRMHKAWVEAFGPIDYYNEFGRELDRLRGPNWREELPKLAQQAERIESARQKREWIDPLLESE